MRSCISSTSPVRFFLSDSAFFSASCSSSSCSWRSMSLPSSAFFWVLRSSTASLRSSTFSSRSVRSRSRVRFSASSESRSSWVSSSSSSSWAILSSSFFLSEARSPLADISSLSSSSSCASFSLAALSSDSRRLLSALAACRLSHSASRRLLSSLTRSVVWSRRSCSDCASALCLDSWPVRSLILLSRSSISFLWSWCSTNGRTFLKRAHHCQSRNSR
mmetsp:Transcript_4337/g.10702  ORF Transcript_4337/g.10702 Transcript_4337/m.10702 type:complete len:218 (+) Transcript_4337:3504-4157(+)